MKKTIRNDLLETSTIVGEDNFRYYLARTWNNSLPKLAFLMLNPSTADEYKDDPTLRRCKGFCIDNGYGTMIIVNLFGIRSTDPRRLDIRTSYMGQEEFLSAIAGKENDEWTMRAADEADHLIVAWGAWGERPFVAARSATVLELLKDKNLFCFGITKDGHPRHPLMVKKDQEIEPYAR